jgi:hypothetical protein
MANKETVSETSSTAYEKAAIVSRLITLVICVTLLTAIVLTQVAIGSLII